MQIFIVKEQLGDYFNYTLNNNNIFSNALNLIKLPESYKIKFNVEDIGACVANEECKNTLLTFFNLSQEIDFISENNITNINNVQLKIQLINLWNVSDYIVSENDKINKYKKWEKETVIKSTTFASLLKLGKGKGLVFDETNIYEVYVENYDIVENEVIPDGTYTILYQLQTEEVEEIEFYGSLELQAGENEIKSDSKINLSITGDKKTSTW